MKAEHFVREARRFLGTPWRHMGRSEAGVDCIGLVILAARRCGLEVEEPPPYQREPQGDALLQGLLRHGRRVAEMAPGDLLLFRMGLYGGHVGVATLHAAYRVPAVLHAYAPRRHVVEQPLDDELRRALVAVIRVAED